MLFEAAGIADILMQANRVQPDGLSSPCYLPLVIHRNKFKILAWDDIEGSFSNRQVDLALLMDKKGLSKAA